MGIYIFSKDALKKLFAENEGAIDFGKEIIPAAINEGYTVASYIYDDYWEDIGTVASFFEANLELTDNLPAFNLFDNQKIVYTRPRLLGPSKIFGTRLIKSVLAEGCILHAKKIEQSIVGIRSRIGARSVLKKAIVFGNDYYQSLEEFMVDRKDYIPIGIGRNCHIENAIIDKNCRIGDNVVILGGGRLKNKETKSYCIVDGIVVLKKGAVIPSGSKIGRKLR